MEMIEYNAETQPYTQDIYTDVAFGGGDVFVLFTDGRIFIVIQESISLHSGISGYFRPQEERSRER